MLRQETREYILDREPIKTEKVSPSFHISPEMSSQSSGFAEQHFCIHTVLTLQICRLQHTPSKPAGPWPCGLA